MNVKQYRVEDVNLGLVKIIAEASIASVWIGIEETSASIVKFDIYT